MEKITCLTCKEKIELNGNYVVCVNCIKTEEGRLAQAWYEDQ